MRLWQVSFAYGFMRAPAALGALEAVSAAAASALACSTHDAAAWAPELSSPSRQQQNFKQTSQLIALFFHNIFNIVRKLFEVFPIPCKFFEECLKLEKYAHLHYQAEPKMGMKPT